MVSVPSDTSMSFSIITVVLDGMPYVREAVESVRTQTRACDEYIIIDAGSQDGTREYLLHMQTIMPQICLIFEEDGGIYHAMNKGIVRAAGDVIGILNSDDRYKPDAIARVEALMSMSECDITGSPIELISARGEYLRSRYIDTNATNRVYFQRMMLPHPTMFVRREVYERVGVYDTQYRLSADHEFLLRCLKANLTLGTLEAPVAQCRVGGASGGVRTFVETRDIAIAYGRSRVVAYFVFFSSLLKCAAASILGHRTIGHISHVITWRRNVRV